MFINFWQFSPLELTALVTVLASGTVSALATGALIYYQERVKQRKYRARLKEHLSRLQRLSSKLLNALDQLFTANSPEESRLYQQFRAQGGELYPDMAAEIRQAIGRAQTGLNAAFALHQKLVDPATTRQRSTEQRIRDWEMLYASLVGPDTEFRHLTAEEVGDLLEPWRPPGTAADSQLTEQLNDLRRELGGHPLDLEWAAIYSANLEHEGLLHHLARLKTQIATLPAYHQQQAPGQLARMQTLRLTVEAEFPPFLQTLYQHLLASTDTSSSQAQPFEPLFLTKEALFTGVDQDLEQAEPALAEGQFLDVLELTQKTERSLDIISAFLQAMHHFGHRQAKIDALTGHGFSPPQLAGDMLELRETLQALTPHLQAGDYPRALPWIEKLNLDSQQALSGAQAWQALHHQNVADLDSLRSRTAQVAHWQKLEVEPAWQSLQAYARPNWSDLADSTAQTLSAFSNLQTNQISQIDSLNSLAVQQFTEAERLLTFTTADLAQVEQQFRAIINRLAEVQAAEASIGPALGLTQADLTRAITLRDQENLKIGPEVDHQLEAARQKLAQAEQLAAAGEFIAALKAQMAARQIAATAYVDANKQVRQINTLQTSLTTLVETVKQKAQQCQTEAQELSAVKQTASGQLLVWQLQDRLSQAEQMRATTTNLEDEALAQALQAAIATYQEVEALAQWTAHQLEADRHDYEEATQQARTALSEAQTVIQQADGVSGANSAQQQAVRRAQQILPPLDDTEPATRKALKRLHQQAEDASRYARLMDKN